MLRCELALDARHLVEEAGMRLEQAGAGNGKCERKSRLDGVEDDRRTMLLPRKQIGQSEILIDQGSAPRKGERRTACGRTGSKVFDA